jgi:2-polyprenyl-6-methoxyphenol hydroxylase-like FAD-dependent oxidoreductase
MTATRTALVIGGGIAGPVAAMALQKAGIEATVYEAYDGAADGVGAGLSIAPNGLNALRVIGADHIVLSIGEPITGMVIQSWTGKRLGEFGTPPGQPPMQFVWRDDLYRGLHDEAARRGIAVIGGKRLIGARDTGSAVTALFSDGTEATADILIGADGIRSTVRSLIDPAAPQPRYAGMLGFGGLLADTGLESTHGKMHMVFGKHAFFGYQVRDDGSGGWFANLPHREPMSIGEARAVGATQWLDTLREAFAADRTPAAALLSRVEPADLLITGALEGMPVVPAWSKGRMVIIGDAAHSTSPSSGQGASLAIESAILLARCLRDLPHAEAFEQYAGLRRARVERIAAMAARTNSDKAAGPVARVLRDLIMPVAMKLLAKPEKMAWQFDYAIDWDSPARLGDVLPVGADLAR